MQPDSLAGASVVSSPTYTPSTLALSTAIACLIWYIFVVLVCTIGYMQLWRHYSSPAPPHRFSNPNDTINSDAPHITIIRPIKGLESHLYDCLASTFRQAYPPDRLHICLCIATRSDPSLPILQQLLQDFPEHDARILVEEEDALLNDGSLVLGPNPKIRNMSRAYREAVGDIVWIIDCNVWVATGVCGRMMGKLVGDAAKGQRPYKFVHQLPVVVDLPDRTNNSSLFSPFMGGRLEEMFMSTAHAKFYTAINTLLIAPCVVGKSTIFRRSHLNALTTPSRPSNSNNTAKNNTGIDHFSHNICEDHLIGDLLWKRRIPSSTPDPNPQMCKHALLFSDLAVQPIARLSLHAYIARRVRWLRVRKFTVLLATLVEPGTESLLCSAYGAYAFTTLPFFRETLGIPQTWGAFAACWFLSVGVWGLMDWTLHELLMSGVSIERDDWTPGFVGSKRGGGDGDAGVGTVLEKLAEYVVAWLGREVLALPIWMWAFWGGTEIEWRGRRFAVGIDMKVREIGESEDGAGQTGRVKGD